mgnify:CR=1 FL=1
MKKTLPERFNKESGLLDKGINRVDVSVLAGNDFAIHFIIEEEPTC